MTEVKYEYAVEYNRIINDPSVRDVTPVPNAEKGRRMVTGNGFFARPGADGVLVRRRMTIESWLAVPEREDCPCSTCVSVVIESKPYPENMMYPFIVCETCGNKRCPHATYHDNECTGSNEPGQKGSRYGGLE